MASMGPPGGGRNPVTPRLLRHFSTVSFAELTDKSICRIFETITSAFATKYLQPDAAAAASEIVGATTTVYNSIRVHLLPTPSKSHYTFNLRDIAKVIQVCMQTSTHRGSMWRVKLQLLSPCFRMIQLPSQLQLETQVNTYIA